MHIQALDKVHQKHPYHFSHHHPVTYMHIVKYKMNVNCVGQLHVFSVGYCTVHIVQDICQAPSAPGEGIDKGMAR